MDDPTTANAGHAADDALNAAQKAVTNLQGQTAAPESAIDPGAAATLKAAQDAIAAARSLNEQVGPNAHPPHPQPRPATPVAQPFPLPPLQVPTQQGRPEGIDLLSDVNLHVKVELGRTKMYVEDVLRLGEGSVVELDKLAGDPVDVYVNDRHVARGEVLVLNDNFCVRINEIIAEVGDQKK